MERKLTTIMAGDVVGYSRMMAEDEESTYTQWRDALREIVEPTLHRHGGRTFKSTGDGFLASFSSVNEALDAAIAIQDGFTTRALQLRMGLNLGDVIEENGDTFGDGVNVAARLESLAEPGSIYVSAAVVRSADKNRTEVFERIGPRRVKNIPRSIEVYAVRPHGSARSFTVAWPALKILQRPRIMISAVAGAAAIASVSLLLFSEGWPPSAGAPNPNGSPNLRALATDTRPAVAVLPFDDMSGDSSQTYFADGLTEDIIAQLARNRELVVIARNSTFALRERPQDIREIGALLGANYVVEGSVRRAGGQLRVVAQLINANTGGHVWSRTYDRQVDDVFALQSDLTAEIAAALVSYVRASETAAVADRPTSNVQAYDLVLRARSSFKSGTPDGPGLLAARELYRRAIELDPNYAAAHASLGMTFIVDRAHQITGVAAGRDLETGLEAARKAVELAPDLPLGYQVLSFGLSAGGDFEGGMQAAERAVQLNPNDPESLVALAKAQVRFGLYPEAVRNAERARRLHPLAPEYFTYVHGQALYASGRVTEAARVLGECLMRAPREANCLRILVAVQVRQGRLAEARETLARLVQVDREFSLATERETRRFGNSPLMEQFLAELTRAQQPVPLVH
jgi:adenylate cyclase